MMKIEEKNQSKKRGESFIGKLCVTGKLLKVKVPVHRVA